MYREWKEIEFPTTRLTGRPRNRWHNEVRERMEE